MKGIKNTRELPVLDLQSMLYAAEERISAADLRKLGLDDVAYLKGYVTTSGTSWIVHAADGTALAMHNTLDAARDSARAQHLGIATVH